METKQDKPQETLEEALKRVGVGKSVRLAEGTIKEEIVPALELAQVNPESIVGIENSPHFFLKVNKEMFEVERFRYFDTVFIGEYLGRDRMSYKSSIAMIKARGQNDGYDHLYGSVFVQLKDKQESVKCYFLLASGRSKHNKN